MSAPAPTDRRPAQKDIILGILILVLGLIDLLIWILEVIGSGHWPTPTGCTIGSISVLGLIITGLIIVRVVPLAQSVWL